MRAQIKIRLRSRLDLDLLSIYYLAIYMLIDTEGGKVLIATKNKRRIKRRIKNKQSSTTPVKVAIKQIFIN